MQQNLSVQDETFSPAAHYQQKGEGQRETLRVHSPEMDGRGEGGENGGVSEERSGQYDAMRCVIGAFVCTREGARARVGAFLQGRKWD